MLLRPLVQLKIPEIERYISEIKTANIENDIDRLERNTRMLDHAVYKLMLEFYFLAKKHSKEAEPCRKFQD
jgi:hypothetical protein